MKTLPETVDEPTTSNVVPFRQPTKEPIAFVRVEDGQALTADRAELWACGACHQIATEREIAVACCRCLHCGFSCQGSSLHRAHKACHDKAELAAAQVEALELSLKTARQFVAATAVDMADYTGAVFDGIDEEDRWFASVDDLRKSARGIKFAWGAIPHPLQLDANDILNNAAEAGEHCEDILEQLADGAREALEKNVADWNEIYASTAASYEVDPSTLVVIDWAAYQAARAEAVDKITKSEAALPRPS